MRATGNGVKLAASFAPGSPAMQTQSLREFAARVAAASAADDRAFRQIIGDLGLLAAEREFTRAFDLDDWTLRRWREGVGVPAPALRRSMYRWLGDRARAELARLAEADAGAAAATQPVAAKPQGLPG
jgi:hypothetical protein